MANHFSQSYCIYEQSVGNCSKYRYLIFYANLILWGWEFSSKNFMWKGKQLLCSLCQQHQFIPVVWKHAESFLPNHLTIFLPSLFCPHSHIMLCSCFIVHLVSYLLPYLLYVTMGSKQHQYLVQTLYPKGRKNLF